MTVSDNTIQVESFSDFLKDSGKKGFNISKELAKNVVSNPTRASDLTPNKAAPSRNPKNVTKTLPEILTFYNTGEGLYSGKFV